MYPTRLITLILIMFMDPFALAEAVLARDIFIAGDSAASACGPEVYPRM
jgi:hypothetical protein